jgi:hypothetical protein
VCASGSSRRVGDRGDANGDVDRPAGGFCVPARELSLLASQRVGLTSSGRSFGFGLLSRRCRLSGFGFSARGLNPPGFNPRSLGFAAGGCDPRGFGLSCGCSFSRGRGPCGFQFTTLGCRPSSFSLSACCRPRGFSPLGRRLGRSGQCRPTPSGPFLEKPRRRRTSVREAA